MTAHDDLLSWRAEFPALETSVYMVSHSLGAMPRRAADDLAEFARLWVERGINAWSEWLPEVERAAERIGRIIGAPTGTVMMATNVSTVQAVVASCLDYRPERPKVVYTELNFPSVSYVWKAEERRGAEVHVVPSDDGMTVDTARILEAIDERTLIVPISHVIFRSAAIQDVAAIVRRAHEVGAMVLLDCYQSTGVVPFSVETLGVDFACGGSVKWLCGGPGAAYLYVRRDRIPEFAPRVTGWFGHRAPFAFTMPEQQYADNVWRYAGGTPAISALYQARAGAEIVAQIGVERIRKKSQRQTERVIAAVDAAGYTLRSPRAPSQRGGSVCFDFPGSERVAAALNKGNFLCDHRPGAGIRMAPHFYNTDEECDRFMAEVERLRKAL
ncbi:MAG TPA: aminotransferase class V-fold PLP-dependent enzyme [Polyangia bacterium]|nr:aminotransferase class V-fold PLP-dependent enzyme [Polyangia bacterium]